MSHVPFEAADYFTTSRVARVLRVAEGTVRQLAQRGDLPSIRLSSGMRLYRRSDVERLAAHRDARAAAKAEAVAR